MRIGIYNPAVGTRYSGGTETFLREMIQRLSVRHDVTLYTGSGTPVSELKESDVDIVQFPWVDKTQRASSFARYLTANQLLSAEVESLSFFTGSKFGQAIDTESLDVLSTHYYLDNFLISRFLDIPTLFRFPGIRKPSPRWKAMARFAQPDVYVSNSITTADRVREWLDINIDRTVYAGVDTDRFSPNTTPAIESEDVKLLFVGRLDPGKGLHELIRSVSRTVQNHDVELYLVGNGILRDELEALSDDLGIHDSVIFVGEVEHGEIHHYYASCDIFCLPSEHEGFPVVNIEAMACGLPVVSTTIPAVKEQIEQGVDGLLVDPGDTEALVEAIERLVSDQELRQQLGSAARAKAVAQFTWDVQVDRMETLYETAIQQHE